MRSLEIRTRAVAETLLPPKDIDLRVVLAFKAKVLNSGIELAQHLFRIISQFASFLKPPRFLLECLRELEETPGVLGFHQGLAPFGQHSSI